MVEKNFREDKLKVTKIHIQWKREPPECGLEEQCNNFHLKVQLTLIGLVIVQSHHDEATTCSFIDMSL